MQGIRSFCPYVLSGYRLTVSFPGKSDLSGEQKNCRLFPFPQEGPLLAALQPVHADVHQHIPVFIVIGGQNLFSVLVKCGITEYFFLHAFSVLLSQNLFHI